MPKAFEPAAKSEAVPKAPVPKAARAGFPPVGGNVHRDFISRVLKDTDFHLNEPPTKRMKLAGEAWMMLSNTNFGCSKCRHSRNGCLVCNPAKAKPKEDKEGKGPK